MIRRKLFVFILTILLVSGQFGVAKASPAQANAQANSPIQHLVVLIQENHTFDNYFGTYPGADGFLAGTKMPVDPGNPATQYITPWHIGTTTITDLSHSGPTFQAEYDNGKWDGFVSGLNALNENGALSMGYYDSTDIPYYWNLASNYVLFDRLFSSARDGSDANHFYLVAGTYPQVKKGQSLATFLDNVPTIFDRLQAAGVSWKFYVENYDPTLHYRNPATQNNRESQVVWVPLLDFNRFIDNPDLSSHIVDLSQYFVDLQQGTLPAVSYIVPSGASEHPPEYPASGEREVKSLVQELMRSSAWNSSAFMLVYDDWGGWYDHVIPPQVDAEGYGARVPGLLVSPYAKKGYIDSTQLDFTSILKFIETNWGVASLSTRDAAANNFLEAFDFTQAARPAELVATTYGAVPAASKNPSNLIFSLYGLALFLTILVIGLAAIRMRKVRLTEKE